MNFIKSFILNSYIHVNIYNITHFSTKYLGGHSDLVAGCLTFGSVDLWKAMIHYQTTLGTSMVGFTVLKNT